MSDDEKHTGVVVWVCDLCDMLGISETGPDGKPLLPVTQEEIAESKRAHAATCKGAN